jgi:hypothetical protein
VREVKGVVRTAQADDPPLFCVGLQTGDRLLELFHCTRTDRSPPSSETAATGVAPSPLALVHLVKISAFHSEMEGRWLRANGYHS